MARPPIKQPIGGKPPDIFVRNVGEIREFIELNHLAPLRLRPAVEAEMAGAGVAAHERGIPRELPELEQRVADLEELLRPGFWLGIPVEHLHYQGDIYRLTEEQWAKFSEQMLATYRERLAAVKQVGFEELKAIGAAVDAAQVEA